MRANTRKGLATAIVVIAVGSVFISTAAEAAQKYSEWTGWRMTDDPLIQWRARTQDWGKNMSPVCEFEIRIDGNAATNFRYDVIFRPEGEGTNGSHRAGMAYGVTRDKDFSDTISGCREVSDIRPTRVQRRTVAPPDAPAPTPSDAGTDGPRRNTGSPTPRDGSSPAARQSIPDVIHFPGRRKPYRGPQLNAVRLDSQSLRSIRSASDRLQKALLDWRPVRAWAYGRATTISQQDWDALSRITARADRATLRALSAEASRHADRYRSTDTLRQFWRSMADLYRYQATRSFHRRILSLRQEHLEVLALQAFQAAGAGAEDGVGECALRLLQLQDL